MTTTSSFAATDATANVPDSVTTNARVPPPSSTAPASPACPRGALASSAKPAGPSADAALQPFELLELLEPHELQPLVCAGQASQAQLHWQLPNPVGQQRVQLGW